MTAKNSKMRIAKGASLAQMKDGQISLRVVVGAKGGVPPIVSASAECPADHADGAVGDVLKSLSEQNVQAMLGQGR